MSSNTDSIINTLLGTASENFVIYGKIQEYCGITSTERVSILKELWARFRPQILSNNGISESLLNKIDKSISYNFQFTNIRVGKVIQITNKVYLRSVAK